MDVLVVEEKGAFNVFDRAYLDYKKFDDYCENGILFSSRLKKNALVEVIKELPVSPGRIKKDSIVILGKGIKLPPLSRQNPARRSGCSPALPYLSSG
ncbi:MAG: hypothetical protein GX263_00530 [Firmicutes bacterium]|nr:hypothetical protein [Bacillota bacterium]